MELLRNMVNIHVCDKVIRGMENREVKHQR